MKGRPAFAAIAVAVATLGLTPAHDRTTELPIEVVLTEGTNMAASVSPDGSLVALDLVGRIWLIPSDGGEAIAITDPFGDARAPTWSPDGERIAFQAFWGGDYDIWVIDADGSNLEQLTHGAFDDREPHWSPDGTKVVFSSDRGGTYDIWETSVESGEVTRLTEGAGNEYTPAYDPTGARIAYAADGDDSGIWVAAVGGSGARVVPVSSGGAVSPAWSPDGTTLSYVREGTGVMDLHLVTADGSDAPGRRVSREGADVFPFKADWTSGSSFVYTADGAVVRGDSGGGAQTIPFRATVTLDRPAYRKRLRSFDDPGPMPVRGVVSPTVSPDGSTIAFIALGDLWLMEIGSEPGRITNDAAAETDPAWSPDGALIAYSSDRSGASEIWLRNVATGEDRQLTVGGGGQAAWSPDGTEIAYLGGGFGPASGVRVVDVETGEARTVRAGLNNPGRPSWAPGGEHVAVSALWTYSSRFREGVNRPLLLPTRRAISQQDMQPGFEWSAAGGAGDVHDVPAPRLQVGERWLDFGPHVSVGTRSTDGPTWSPNGRMIAYVAGGLLWVQDVQPDGTPVGGARRLNNELTADPSWSGDSRSVVYLATSGLKRVWLESGEIEEIPLGLTYRRAVPTGRTVVHAGALFDGESSELRRDIDIVIEGNRIARIVPHGSEQHSGRVIDAGDAVVSPGFIEMHMHGGLSAGEAAGRQWLAYGVTSVRTPAADPYETTEDRESYAELRRIGPRLFGTGYTIDGSRIYYGGAPALAGSGQVELYLDEAEKLGLDLLKTYVRLPDAVQRRVIQAGHEMGLPITSHELYPAVAYGADGVEHVRGTSRRGYSTKVTALNRSYQDVVSLLGASGMTITPTVGIYGGYATAVGDDPSLLQDRRIPVFIGPQLDVRFRGSTPTDTQRDLVSSMASLGRRVLDAGGTVVVGTDAPIFPAGWGLVAEMQILVEYGGMTPLEVLRGTTSVAAEAMGYGADLGRIRPGALADLVILEENPIDDIRNVRSVRTVIRDGRVFTLDQLLDPDM